MKIEINNIVSIATYCKMKGITSQYVYSNPNLFTILEIDNKKFIDLTKTKFEKKKK